ncbi:MAG: hypothetical protein ABFD69_03125 [Candidatus Sumerlaeia bacterium]
MQIRTPDFPAKPTYRSAWKRRLILFAIGVGLIGLSELIYPLLCLSDARQAAEPVDSISTRNPVPVRPVLYMGALTPAALNSNPVCVNALGKRASQALLLIPNQDASAFYPVYYQGELDYWDDYIKRPAIPTPLLDFTPEAVMAAFKRTNPADLNMNGFAQNIEVRQWNTKNDGSWLELKVRYRGNGFNPFWWYLTIYGVREGKLQTAFASMHGFSEMFKSPEPQYLMTSTRGGIESYQWSSGQFCIDNTVKQKLTNDYRSLCWLGNMKLIHYCSGYALNWIFLLWLCRAISSGKVLFERLFQKEFSYAAPAKWHRSPMIWMFGLFVLFAIQRSVTSGLSPMIAFAGWILIGLAAAIPIVKVRKDIVAEKQS